MIKALVIWLALSVAMALGIQQVRHMSGLKIWSLARSLAFGAGCATLALLVLFAIVILF